jgi:hypothetical protein
MKAPIDNTNLRMFTSKTKPNISGNSILKVSRTAFSKKGKIMKYTTTAEPIAIKPLTTKALYHGGQPKKNLTTLEV